MTIPCAATFEIELNPSSISVAGILAPACRHRDADLRLPQIENPLSFAPVWIADNRENTQLRSGGQLRRFARFLCKLAIDVSPIATP